MYLKALKTVSGIEIYLGNFLAKNVWRPVTNLPISQREIGTSPVITPSTASYYISPFDGDPRSRLEILSSGLYPAAQAQRPRRIKVPVPKAVMAQFYCMEEKGSDVNLACHLVNDAWENVYDVAVVISNDTDLVEPIRIVTQKRKKDVVLISPGHWNTAPKLAQVATSVRHLNSSILKDSQFAETIPGTTITRPSSWSQGQRAAYEKTNS
jgi:hypothetical protein